MRSNHTKLEFSKLLAQVIAVFITTVLFSKLFGPNFGPIIFFIVSASTISFFIPSKFATQRLAISSILIVGLSPIYLIIRGFYTRENLNDWDLQLYLLLLIMIFLVFEYLKISFSTSKSNFQKKKFEIENLPSVAVFSSMFFTFIVSLILKNRSFGDSVAWAMSGDSKEHFVNSIRIIDYGYLNPETFLIQPSSSPSFLSLVLSQFQVNIDEVPNQLIKFLPSYSYVWILLIGILGISFAAVMEIVWKQINPDKKIPRYLLAAASFLSVMSFAIGPAFFDGFFTAIYGISVVVALLGWFIEIGNDKKPKSAKIFLGIVLLHCSLFAWSFVTPFTFILVILGIRNNLRESKKFKGLIDPIGFSLLFIAAVSIHFSVIGQEFIYKAKFALNTAGAVNASNPTFFAVVISVLFTFGFLLNSKKELIGKSLILISLVQLIALLGFKNFSNLSFLSWNYYLLKYQWIMLVALCSLLFALILSQLFKNFGTNKINRIVIVLFILGISFLISETFVSANRVWKNVWAGWQNPKGHTINKVLEQEIDVLNPTMFFHYGYAGDAMLANFWLTAFTNPVDPIKGWNYTIDTAGDVRQLCDVNAYYPQVKVITSDMKLEEFLQQTCPNERFIIELKPPSF